MSEHSWWYLKKDKRQGPVTFEELERLYASQAIGPDTLVWCEGMESWKPLSQVDALSQLKETLPPPLPPNEPLSLEQYPEAGAWKRFFARILDLWWETVLFTGVTAFLLGYFAPAFGDWIMQPGASQLFTILVFPLVFIFDAAIHGIFGRTPGKALIGITVVTADNQPLSFSQYLSRNMGVWAFGVGLGIPLVNLIAMAVQHGRRKKGKPAGYDRNPGYIVRAKPIGWLRVSAFTLVFIMTMLGVAILGYMDQQAEKKYNKYQTKTPDTKPQSWENTHTGHTASIASYWTHQTDKNEDGQEVEFFSHPAAPVYVVFARETSDMSIEGYAQSFMQANQGNMTFKDQGTYADSTNGQADMWINKGGVGSGGYSSDMVVEVRHFSNSFWRVVTIQPENSTTHQDELDELSENLWRTIPYFKNLAWRIR